MSELEGLKKRIEKWVDSGGNHAHNMISLNLRRVAAEFGRDAANQIIDDLGIEDLYGIRPETSRDGREL